MKRLSYLIIAVLAGAMLIACGSDSTSLPLDVRTGEGVEITCADAESTYNDSCTAEKAMSKPGLSRAAQAFLVNVPSSIFNSGILNTNDNVSAEIEIYNWGAETARFYLFTDRGGICGGHSTGAGLTFDVPASSSALETSIGTNFEICATPGDVFYEVFVINASDYALGEFGSNPPTNEVLYQARVNFTYKAP